MKVFDRTTINNKRRYFSIRMTATNILPVLFVLCNCNFLKDEENLITQFKIIKV